MFYDRFQIKALSYIELRKNPLPSNEELYPWNGYQCFLHFKISKIIFFFYFYFRLFSGSRVLTTPQQSNVKVLSFECHLPLFQEAHPLLSEPLDRFVISNFFVFVFVLLSISMMFIYASFFSKGIFRNAYKTFGML